MAFEYIEDAGVVAARHALDEKLVADFYAEGVAFATEFSAGRAVPLSERQGVYTLRHPCAPDESMYPAFSKVLGLLSVDGHFVLNYQPPHSKQTFHPDISPIGSVAVVLHVSPEGAFDYTTKTTDVEKAEADYKTVGVGTGDVVVLLKPNQLHRGRNPSDQARITLAYTVLPRMSSYDFESSWESLIHARARQD